MGKVETCPVQVGDEAPDFVAETQFGDFHFREFTKGSWCVFFSHPADFTPVCTTEFGMVSKLYKDFEARNCKVVGMSVDSVESHKAWIKDINETQSTKVTFPIVADEKGSVATAFGMCSKPEVRDAVPKIETRTLYIIDSNNKVQLHMAYPSNVGRNFYEILRILDALQLTAFHNVGTPANWKVGEDILILPEVTEEEASEQFPKGFTEIKPYLRLTPVPDKKTSLVV
mmetsp:Transcript_1141/g.1645  ORF Transcript_1141/g.1645 Transcript_1141/m.1645 type:complete len:228 (+) Transcript_1141:371-1054(+)|eukprot:CAMPEP_0184014760 /NCGR_PEP_ID=MMETSP0954-20121128/5885_1 /TAXON_ID=627963 /ORGANISM="Aplanochytrium sp, Strain PBS07" /LENGTH=227 /DNA_ID=CAMNT_0026295371 /DNA_START=226 /DNA_END=909 /DNA_ORIENTATION=-